MEVVKKLYRAVRKYVGDHILRGRFPYAYAHYYFWLKLREELDYKNPKGLNQKLYWLARYWQDPRVVSCADKLAVRDYVKENGLEYILTKLYAVYDTANQIDFSQLPDRFVLKCNHCGSGINMVLCRDKSLLNESEARASIDEGLHKVIGLETCEYHYQYIKPTAFAEEFIGADNDDRLEIQFFCFNGRARHILVRNDLGDAAQKPFAISYDMNWNRVQDRKYEDMSIDIPCPDKLDEMIGIANKLAAPFPQVRIDLYLVNKRDIYFGEMTFTTSGGILYNYTPQVIKEWGEELVLPAKLKTKWSDVYTSQLKNK